MAFLAFFLTFLELAAAGLGYALQSEGIFSMVVTYGSPIYLFRNLFGGDSVFFSGNPYYIGMFALHALKYGALIKAQFSGEGGKLFWLAVMFEATYLLLCAYYML